MSSSANKSPKNQSNLFISNDKSSITKSKLSKTITKFTQVLKLLDEKTNNTKLKTSIKQEKYIVLEKEILNKVEKHINKPDKQIKN